MNTFPTPTLLVFFRRRLFYLLIYAVGTYFQSQRLLSFFDGVFLLAAEIFRYFQRQRLLSFSPSNPRFGRNIFPTQRLLSSSRRIIVLVEIGIQQQRLLSSSPSNHRFGRHVFPTPTPPLIFDADVRTALEMSNVFNKYFLNDNASFCFRRC